MNIERYKAVLQSHGADAVVEISTAHIVTAAWTIMKCRYGCPAYGHNRCCPPFAPGHEEMARILKEFSRALLFRTFDMNAGTPAAIACAKAMFADGFYKAIALGMGPCRRCEKCTPHNCPSPGETAPSPEACGIDVIETARKAGFDVKIPAPEGEKPACFGIVLWH